MAASFAAFRSWFEMGVPASSLVLAATSSWTFVFAFVKAFVGSVPACELVLGPVVVELVVAPAAVLVAGLAVLVVDASSHENDPFQEVVGYSAC